MALMNKSLGLLVNTFIFTVFVPGTVAGYGPWLLRHNVAPVTGAEEWAALTVIAIGTAIYLYTAFWGFALVGGGTPAPIAPTKTLVVKGLHRFVRNPMYIGVGLVMQASAALNTEIQALGRRFEANPLTRFVRLRRPAVGNCCLSSLKRCLHPPPGGNSAPGGIIQCESESFQYSFSARSSARLANPRLRKPLP